MILIIILVLAASCLLNAQPVPTAEENLPYLVTFGSAADKSWGDDDFCQIFFYVIPASSKTPFYVRIYDPDTGGEIDEIKETADTKTKFSIYGGTGSYTDKDARKVNPEGNYKSGNLMASKIFAADSKYDKNWYSFGPFNPSEGEYVKKFDGYVFKIIAEGVAGNDGNLYKYYFSTKTDDNAPMEGGNTFTYEYTFRLSDNAGHISHIYPFVDDKVVTMNIHIFDWDSEGKVRIVSNARKGQACKLSGDSNWAETIFDILEDEKNSTFDVQFVKPSGDPMKNNNAVIYITNQYNETLPFYTSPIGGAPQYQYKIGVINH
ncbi:MAG: hypothetical protein ABIJ16_05330 [Bacteroidota bacterium]